MEFGIPTFHSFLLCEKMSSTPYFLYHSLQKSTGARHCCLAKFYNEEETNIITCSSNTMVVYKIVKCIGGEHDGENRDAPCYKLKITDEFSFNGEILCVVSVPICKLAQIDRNDRRDGLILSFRGNYVSSVAFDTRNGGMENYDALDLNDRALIALNGKY